MKSSIIEKQFNLSFDAVFNAIKKNVVSNGFILLHEIDTQNIVSKYNIAIGPLRQLLFFHPKYIQTIVTEDKLAINEIPIKVVIIENQDKSVSVSFPNPMVTLSDYDIKKEMAVELLNRINTVLTIK